MKHIQFGLVPAIYMTSLFLPEFKSFYELSYGKSNGNKTVYTSGPKDVLVVFFYTCLFLTARNLFMKIRINVKKELRLKEQLYQASVYTLSFIFGMYNYYNSPLVDSWVYIVHPYPQKFVPYHLKQYYLFIFSLWTHMIFVLHLEKRRKDHNMMLVHHFVALSMVVTSWFAHGSLLGILIETIFDSMDIVLCLAKSLKYIKQDKLADVFFLVFVVGWVYTRQYLYVHVVYQWMQFPDYNELKWDPANGHYVNEYMMFWSKVLMIGLLVMVFFWFMMILKLVFKVVSGNNVEDSRSDDEDDKEKDQ